MGYRPGDTLIVVFPVSSSTGALTNADALPTASLMHNGTADGTVVVTVVNVSTGIYKATCTIPGSYAGGDSIATLIDATIGGVAAGQVIGNGAVDRPTVALSTGDEANLALISTVNTNVAALPSASATAAAVFSADVLGSLTFTNLLQVISSALAGPVSGASGSTLTFKDILNTKTVIVATTDVSGDRLTITLTP